ncbi:UNVERIFIED_CONTAM: Glucan endo-1,3-beta-glucosidase 13 [Sesamum latifolium]|uniref:Glucan endo-1,3-beta-glucosidase 13 n=1 Tax=Sesamum latifolium TaxID=2727402 RepID=A0AAW2TCY8_9LAMI
MGRGTIITCLSFIHLAAVLLLPSSIEAASHVKSQHHKNRTTQETISISTRQMDVTTPLTTVPTTNPSTPTTTTPMLNPTDSDPDSPRIMSPVMTPPAANSPAGSWCVASQSASQNALQLALDYACGHGGADCSAIQPGGSCYMPATVRDHASYAFNSYYQKNPIPTSCNFGGSAVTTSTDPVRSLLLLFIHVRIMGCVRIGQLFRSQERKQTVVRIHPGRFHTTGTNSGIYVMLNFSYATCQYPSTRQSQMTEIESVAVFTVLGSKFMQNDTYIECGKSFFHKIVES